MIDSNLKQELLNTKSLKKFQTICLKHKLRMNDLDVEILKHYASLGHGGNAYDHTDPREAFR